MTDTIIRALEHALYKVQLRVIDYALNQKTQNAEDVLTQIEKDVQTILALRGYKKERETTADMVKEINEDNQS